MKRFFIIADDFTGSNDTGVQLTRRGYTTRVVLDSAGIPAESLSCVLDTESRNIPESCAGDKVRGLLADADLSRFDCVIKKVDSTLRGNIAAEVYETDAAYGSGLVVFMPALPGLGRTTVNGIHMLNGVRILDTELAKDPRKPVLEDNITAMLQAKYSEPVSHIPLEKIRGGDALFGEGRVFTCDAETDADMRRVITAAAGTGKRVLWVGTAAIADNITAIESRPLPVLSVITSVSSVTVGQMKFAAGKGLDTVAVDTAALVTGGGTAEYVEAVLKLLSEGRNAALVSDASLDRSAMERTVAAGAAAGLDADAVAERVCAAITAAAKEILKKTKVSGLYLSGGDTAIHFLAAVGAAGCEIVSELTTGIPMMKLSGGCFDGLRIVTKAGAFGDEKVIPFILRKLEEA